MTIDKKFKRRVRARAQATGEAYTAARRHIRRPLEDGSAPFRMAVAELDVPVDPRDSDAIRRVGGDARRLMTEARAGGARLIHLCEITNVLHYRIADRGRLDPVGDSYAERVPQVDEPA